VYACTMYQRFAIAALSGRVCCARFVDTSSSALGRQCGPPKTNRTSQPRTWSVKRKNIDASVTITKTMRVVIHTSFQVGHVTLEVSWRTS
jgi:hypothetical protein